MAAYFIAQYVVKDPKLCRLFSWYPVRKYIVKDGREIQILDDIDCGSDWWDVQVHLV